MVTATMHEHFQRWGFFCCKALLPAAPVADARDAILRHLDAAGVRHAAGWLREEEAAVVAPNLTKRLTNAFKQSRVLTDLIATAIPPLLTALVGGRALYPILSYPHLLFTLPNAQEWTLPHKLWHLDLPRLPAPDLPGIQIFTFLDRVQPGGGGTLVVAGSHHLLNEGRWIRSQDLKRRLKQHPYFAALMAQESGERDRFLAAPEAIDGVELQVIELHGEPGDVYFTDLRLLHTIAPNAAAHPRLMLTQRYLLERSAVALYGTNLPAQLHLPPAAPMG